MKADFSLGNAPAPRITVAIPTSNQLSLLQESVASVLSQTFTDWELLVLDDNPTESVRVWLNSIADARIRVCRAGFPVKRSAARNDALIGARAPYIIFLDEGDRLKPGALRSLIAGSEKAPEAVAVIGRHVLFDTRGNRHSVRHPRCGQTRWVWRDVLVGWSAQTGAILYRLDIVRALGGWTDRCADHQDLLLRVSSRGKVHLLTDIVLEQRIGQAPAHTKEWARDERTLRADFLARCGGMRRRSARRLLRCWETARRGDAAIARRRYGRALGWYIEILWNFPALLGSPLVRRRFAVKGAKAFVGLCLTGPRVAVAQAAKAGTRALPGPAAAGKKSARHRSTANSEYSQPAIRRKPARAESSAPWRAGVRILLPGSVANLAVQGLLLVFGLGTGTVTARVLGPAQRGELSFLVLVPSTLTVIGSLGVEYGTYYLWHQEQGRLRSRLLGAGAVVVSISGLFFAGVGFLVVSWFEPRTGVLSALLVALGTPLTITNAILTMALMANRRVVAYNVSRLVGPMTYTIAITMLWVTGVLGVKNAFLAWFGSVLLTVTTDLALVARMGSVIPRWEIRTARRSIGYGLRSYVGTVAQYGTLQLDQGLLVVLAGNGALGLYYAAVSVGQVVLYLANNIASAMMGQLGGRSRVQQRRLAVVAMSATAIGTAVTVALLMFLGGPVITLVLGRAYLPGLTALQILLPGLVCLATTRVMNCYFIAVGEARVFARAALASLIVTVVGDLLLIPEFQASGAALALTLAYGVMAVWLLLTFRAHGRTASNVQDERSCDEAIGLQEPAGGRVGRGGNVSHGTITPLRSGAELGRRPARRRAGHRAKRISGGSDESVSP